MTNNRSARCNGAGNGGCATLMKQLQAVDFSLYELVLYLDAYPESEEAKAMYQKLLNERTRLADAYEKQCGPLTAFGNHQDGWKWTEGPWPWEADAN